MLWIATISAIITAIISIFIAAITFISLIVAVISFWIKIKDLNLKLEERTAPYSQALYIRQIDGYLELIDIMMKIENQMKLAEINLGAMLGKVMSDFKQHRVNYQKKIKDCQMEYRDKLLKWGIIFPDELRDSFVKYFVNIDIENFNSKIISDIRKEIYQIAYKKFGIKPLSKKSERILYDSLS